MSLKLSMSSWLSNSKEQASNLWGSIETLWINAPTAASQFLTVEDVNQQVDVLNYWNQLAAANKDYNLQHSQFYRLPEELQLHIFSFLPARDLLQTLFISSTFTRLANDNFLWEALCRKEEDKLQVFCNHGSQGTESGTISLESAKKWATSFFDSILVEDQQTTSEENDVAQEHTLTMQGCSTVNWKRTYYELLRENSLVVKKSDKKERLLDGLSGAPQVHSSKWVRKLRMPFRKRVLQVAMFGRGLDHSAKKLLYNMMWGLNSPFQMVGLYPGEEGIGSGVAFDVDGKEMNLAVVYEEERALEKLKQSWKAFFENADGLVFVVDNTADEEALDKSLLELKRFVNFSNNSEQESRSNEERRKAGGGTPDDGESLSLAQTNSPLLILLFGKEEEDQEDNNNNNNTNTNNNNNSGQITPAYLAKRWHLTQAMNGRKWCIRAACSSSMVGVAEGLYWLAQNIQ